MKKIVRQQNYLKELINSQENKPISKETLKATIKGLLEPLLDKPEVGVVLYRIIDQTGLKGLIQRLKFSEIEAYDFSDESENLREKVWANTEFLCILTHRFVSIILWDSNTEDKNFVRYYSIYNSRLQEEALDIINRNSIIDVKGFHDRFRPDRRDNTLLNSSIRKIIENLDESSKDAVLGFAEEQNFEPLYDDNTRYIAHEIKNQLSIVDLYTEVIRKYCAKNNINDENLNKNLNCISRAIQLASNSLISLKSINNLDLKVLILKDLISEIVDLTKVYSECKNIEYIVENEVECEILADKDKLSGVLINLIKNASEAFEIDENVTKNGKYIKIKTEIDGDFGIIRISNNGKEIVDTQKIFDKGFTTKNAGSGLGLYICKKTMEEQCGQLELVHSGSDYTEFVVKIGLV